MELSVQTKSGKMFNVDHCVATNIGYRRVLYIEFMGYSMVEIFGVFSDPNETQIIHGFVGEQDSKEYVGYTKLAEIFIVPEDDTHVRIRLEQEDEIDELGK